MMAVAEETNITWEVLRLPSNLVPNPDHGDLMTVDEFVSNVESGGFIDYDGYGYWATDSKCDQSSRVYPSNVKKGQIPPYWATHVVWFNR